MSQSAMHTRPAAEIPRSVRIASACFLVLSILLAAYVLWAAAFDGFSRRDWPPVLGFCTALYLWIDLRSGHRGAWSTALVFGVTLIVVNAGALLYGVETLRELDASRAEVVLLSDALFIGPAAALIAALVAVAVLMRRDSRTFFRSQAAQGARAR